MDLFDNDSELMQELSVTPLERAIRQAHSGMSAGSIDRLVRNLKVLQQSGFNRIGTLSSGSDLISVVYKRLCEYWSETFGVELAITSKFACESVPEKQEFILNLFVGDACVFTNNEDMNTGEGWCVRHDKQCCINHVRFGSAGFSCQSRSAANQSRAKNVNCVQNGEGKTGESFEAVRRYLERHHPDCFMLENVPGLAQTVKGGGDSVESDAEYIVRELKKCGYQTVVQISTSAADHGSPCCRKRLYWLAVLSPGKEDTIISIIEECKFPRSLEFENFLMDEKDRSLHLLPVGTSMTGPKYEKMTYKAEHMELYDKANLPWPAPREGPQAEVLKDIQFLNQLHYEVAFFLHFCYLPTPVHDVAELPYYEFVDRVKKRAGMGRRREIGRQQFIQH